MDQTILLLINSPAGKSELMDGAVKHISNNPLFKGIFPMMIVWGLWFSSKKTVFHRDRILALLTISILAAVTGRASALLLPYRDRPIHTPDLELNGFINRSVLEGWSSFPSDHAALFFAIATSALTVSRMAGLILLTHAVLVISLPRIYLGLHWPSDIFFGGIIGVVLATVGTIPLAPCLSPLENSGNDRILLSSGIPFVISRHHADRCSLQRHSGRT